MSKRRGWSIDGFTLIMIIVILAGVVQQYIDKMHPTPKEKAVVIQMGEKGKQDKVKFFDGVVKTLHIDDAYSIGDTVLVERK